MAEVSLRHIKKIYPNTEKKKKKGESEKKSNLKVTSEGVMAVQDFSLEIADKEFIVLVGPSGCGKSTTPRMIAGLEEISAGELYIDGKLCNHSQSCGLTAAGRTDKNDKFLIFDFQVNVVNGYYVAVINFFQTFQ